MFGFLGGTTFRSAYVFAFSLFIAFLLAGEWRQWARLALDPRRSPSP